MPRLIDANKLPHYDGTVLSAVAVARAVEDAPTVDAEPVRHGHWIKSEDADDGYCSVCKCDMPMYKEDWEWKYSETPYCPNCGAKMKGDNNGNK